MFTSDGLLDHATRCAPRCRRCGDPVRRRLRRRARLGREIDGVDASDIQVPVDADDIADIMYTSGTTGLPEGRARAAPQRRDDPERAPHWTNRGWLHGAPLFTFAGMSFIFNPMKMGLTGLYMPKFDVDHWFDVVERDKPMMIFLVPAMAELITASPRFDGADLSAPDRGVDRQRAARARDAEASCRTACRRRR